MCLAIYAPGGLATIPTEYIHEASYTNPDGIGYAIADGVRILRRRAFFDPDECIRSFDTVDVQAPAMLHFRWSTSGKIDRRNCHPFLIDDGLAVCHNGVLGAGSPTLSDTALAVRGILRRVHTYGSIVECGRIQGFLSRWAGKHNKLVFLRSDGSSHIVNETEGIWRDGVWYSNSSGFTYRQSFRWAGDSVTPAGRIRDSLRWSVSSADVAKLLDWHERGYILSEELDDPEFLQECIDWSDE